MEPQNPNNNSSQQPVNQPGGINTGSLQAAIPMQQPPLQSTQPSQSFQAQTPQTPFQEEPKHSPNTKLLLLLVVLTVVILGVVLFVYSGTISTIQQPEATPIPTRVLPTKPTATVTPSKNTITTDEQLEIDSQDIDKTFETIDNDMAETDLGFSDKPDTLKE